MRVYVRKTNEIVDLPAQIQAFYRTMPNPEKGIFEYIEPKFNPQTQTLGKIIVLNNIATKEIINFKNWIYPEMPIRITVREKLLKSNKKFNAFAFDVMINNTKSFRFEIENKKYVTAYLSYLNVSDGFSLDENNKIIFADNDLQIEQIDSNFILNIIDEETAICHA